MKHYLILLFVISVFKSICGQSVVPLDIGNKWIFNVVEITRHTTPSIDTSIYIKTYEVMKDTIISIYTTYFKSYKVLVTYNSKIDYEYWDADSNKFYILYYSNYPFYPPYIVKYDAQIKKDTTDWLNNYIKLYEMNFLNIQNRAAQESSSHVGILDHRWEFYYTTALNFGIIKIKVITQGFTFLQETLETIKGAYINGIIYGDTITTSIRNQNSLYEFYILSQNYPNPFNPTTKIVYSIPTTSFVKLKVYDILGREVAALVDEEKSVGSYNIEFNGSGLSSGIYFYKIQAGDYSSVKKMILVK